MTVSGLGWFYVCHMGLFLRLSLPARAEGEGIRSFSGLEDHHVDVAGIVAAAAAAAADLPKQELLDVRVDLADLDGVAPDLDLRIARGNATLVIHVENALRAGGQVQVQIAVGDPQAAWKNIMKIPLVGPWGSVPLHRLEWSSIFSLLPGITVAL